MVYDTISVIYLYYHFSVSPHIPCRLANMKTSGLTPATGKMLRQSQCDLNVKKISVPGTLSSDTEVGKMHGFKQTHYFSSLKQQCRKHSGYIF